jgi:polyadenylate-binding protein
MSAPGTVIVNDLPDNVTEEFLRKLFNEVGEIRPNGVTIKSRNSRSGQKGYFAFLQFEDQDVALRAISELNYTKLDGYPIRMMLADRETKAIMRSNQGNLFVKNLDESIEDSQLHDAFASFGEVISCKIHKDEHGRSQGYGYVQFRNPDDARNAMEDLKESTINGRPLQIQPYMRHQPRQPEASFTNVYIKNLPESIETTDQLVELFQPFGEVTAPHLMLDQNGCSRGFGFCNMADHDMAVAAVVGLNGQEYHGKTLFCSRAMSRLERKAKLAEETDRWRRRTHDLYKGRNLYVKNFEDSMTEEDLRELFSRFGEVESVKIQLREGAAHQRFGFVCFADAQGAARAIGESVLIKSGGRNLYVSELTPSGERRTQNLARIRQRNERQQAPDQPARNPAPQSTFGAGWMPAAGTGQAAQGFAATAAQPAQAFGFGQAPQGFGEMPAGFAQAPQGFMPGMGVFGRGQQGFMPGMPGFGAGYEFGGGGANLTAKAKVRQEVLERRPGEAPVIRALNEMSEQQAAGLAANQGLLVQWLQQF